jgi:hypothetical protein
LIFSSAGVCFSLIDFMLFLIVFVETEFKNANYSKLTI